MKRTWKKPLSALMALVMAMSLCIIPAAAEEETGAIPDPIAAEGSSVETMENDVAAYETTIAVAKIGETTYETISAAVADGDNSTITLLSNVTEDVVIPSGKTITLDLNGYTLTNVSGDTIVNNGTLTVADSSTGKTGMVSCPTAAKSALLNNVGAAATLNGGKFYKNCNVDTNDYYVITNHGVQLTINAGVAIESTSTYSSAIENGWYNASANTAGTNSTMTINGGSVTASGGLYTVKNDDYGVMTINGGTYTNTAVSHGCVLNWNDMTINGGTFNAQNSAVVTAAAHNTEDGGAKYTYEIGTTVITGGTFHAALGTVQETPPVSVSVSGGTFSADPTAYLASGYRATSKNNVYTVGTAAKIGDTAYATLAAAISAANGKTVKLMDDIAENVVIPSNTTLTLDLNGKTLNGGTAAKKPALLNNGTVTIKDSGTGGMIKRDDVNVGGYYVIDNQGTMSIESGKVYNHTGTAPSGSSLIRNAGVSQSAAATLNIKGGTIQQDGFIAVKNDDYGTLNITGGTIIATGSNNTSTISAVQNWSQANLTGGTFTGAIWTSVWSESLPNSKTIIDGAQVQATGRLVAKVDASYTGDTKKPVVEVKNGTFNLEWHVDDATMVSISGGTFATDPTAYLASGYSVRRNGANYEVYKPSSGSSGSSGGSTTTPPKTETESKTEGDVTTKTETTTTTNKDGSKTTEVKETATNAATGEKTELKATETVAKDGSVTREEVKTTTAADGAKTEEKTTETVDAKTGTGTTATVKTDAMGKSTASIVVENTKSAKEVTLPADAVKSAAQADEATMTVRTAGAEITLDAAAISAVAEAKGDKVSITVETVKTEALPEAAKEILEDAIVVNLSISVGDTKVSDFNGGKVTVSVPYVKTDSAKSVAVYYVANDGSMQRVPGATYDEKTKSVVFTTGHFSFYAMVEETALAFTDVADADWYYDAVRYVTEAQLFNGTGATTFGPNGTMTREMLATVLYRKAGSPAVNGALPGAFADSAKISAWATDAMGWAVQEGILTGVGQNSLDPQGAVTRQQLAVILYRAAGSPEAPGTALGEYADGASVAAWATDGMAWAVRQGVVTGRGNNLLAPEGTANRAEVATMLMRAA